MQTQNRIRHALLTSSLILSTLAIFISGAMLNDNNSMNVVAADRNQLLLRMQTAVPTVSTSPSTPASQVPTIPPAPVPSVLVGNATPTVTPTATQQRTGRTIHIRGSVSPLSSESEFPHVDFDREILLDQVDETKAYSFMLTSSHTVTPTVLGEIRFDSCYRFFQMARPCLFLCICAVTKVAILACSMIHWTLDKAPSPRLKSSRERTFTIE